VAPAGSSSARTSARLTWAPAAAAAVVLGWGERLLGKLQGAQASLGPAWRTGLVSALLLTAPITLFTDNLRRVDGSQDYEAADFSRLAFARAERDAVIPADWWAIAPMGYLKYVERARPDLTLAPAFSTARPAEMDQFLNREYLGRFAAAYGTERLTHRLPEVRRRFLVVPEGPLNRILLNPPDPATLVRPLDLPASGGPLAEFGGRIGLVRTEMPMIQARLGEVLPVTHFWTNMGGVPTGPYDTVTMLVDEADRLAWSEKVQMGHGLYPMRDLARGQMLIERRLVYLTDMDPGRYRVAVTVRDRAVNRRLLPALLMAGQPARGGGYAVVVGSVEVLPPAPRH
jgi:hypothetical protein